MNWGEVGESKHAALWFDSLNNQWKPLYVTETEDPLLMSTMELSEFMEYFENAEVYNVVPMEAAPQIRDKEILEINRQLREKLNRIQNAFIKTWNSLEMLLRNLPPEERTQIQQKLEEVRFYENNAASISWNSIQQGFAEIEKAVKKEPENWREALELCAQLRILQKRLLAHEFEEIEGFFEFRTLRPLAQNKVYQYLDSQQAFEEAVVQITGE